MAIVHGIPDTEKRFLEKLPNKVKSIDDVDKVHRQLKDEFHTTPDKGLGNKFHRWKQKRQINKIEKNKNNPLHAGAKGEIRALNTLKKLDDTHHILCGLYIELPNWITYGGKKNLRSAQMDFVIVSKRGIVLIEVKNWSDTYIFKNRRNGGLEPHEQVDRAGRVLWVALKSWRSPKNPAVSSVLLSIQGNIKYSYSYSFVKVKDIIDIIPLIENQKVKFSDKEVKRIVNRLKSHITK